MEHAEPKGPANVQPSRIWFPWIVLAIFLGAAAVAARFLLTHRDSTARSPVEVRHVATQAGKATFWLTNHGAFNVIVQWTPTLEFEVLRSGHWETLTNTTVLSAQPTNPMELGAHEATSLTQVELPQLGPGTIWRLHLIVCSSEGALGYWIRHPLELFNSLQFRDPNGGLKISLPWSSFPTITQTSTSEERVP